jgi:hypothetical protein
VLTEPLGRSSPSLVERTRRDLSIARGKNIVATYQLREPPMPVRCRDESYSFPEEIHAHDRLHRRAAVAAVCKLQHLLPQLKRKTPPDTRAICRGFRRAWYYR